MQHNLEQRIRERAYDIWNASGRIDGQADEFWFAAERELLAPAAAAPAAAPVKAAPVKVAAKPTARRTLRKAS